MSFLSPNNHETLSARLTNKGRKSIAQGNFVIQYFQIGDSEYDYNFTGYTNNINGPFENILSPMDNETYVKYPYSLNEVSSGTTTITYGTPISSNSTLTVRNSIPSSGFVSEYDVNGSNIQYETQVATSYSGNTITIPTGTTFNNGGEVTLAFTTFVSSEFTIPTGTPISSLTYKIQNISGNTITLDRDIPIGITSNIQVISHNSTISSTVDPWNVEIVSTELFAGVTGVTNSILHSYSGNTYSSIKEYLGYTTSSGQTSNTGTTYTNSFNESITLTPENQRTIAVLHYSQIGDSVNDEDRFFKYEDYIGSSSLSGLTINEELITDVENFQIYIPFLLYHRNTGTTIGALFTMDTTNYFINSTKTNKTNLIKYRYLIDEYGNKVGKVFVDKKIIVFDDQEIVVALDYGSNRKYTLPAPKITKLPTDLSCGEGDLNNPLITSGETAYITYLLENTNDVNLNALHCNYYGNILSDDDGYDVGMKFSTNEFTYLTNGSDVSGYTANKLYAIAQVVTTGLSPDPTGWKKIDITDQVQTGTTLFTKDLLQNKQFAITGAQYNAAPQYILFPDRTYKLCDKQFFPGSVRLTRCSDIETMSFAVNLPSGQFETTQNPTYSSGIKKITEVALLNSNKEILVYGKTTTPLTRNGTQVISLSLDF